MVYDTVAPLGIWSQDIRNYLGLYVIIKDSLSVAGCPTWLRALAPENRSPSSPERPNTDTYTYMYTN